MLFYNLQEIDELQGYVKESVEALSKNDSRIENLMITQFDQIENEIVVIQDDIETIQNDVLNMKEMPIGR